MKTITRRELLGRAGAVAAGAALSGFRVKEGFAGATNEERPTSSFEWFRSLRLLIAEGYCPPFYPSLDYEPEKALALARRLNCDSIRYPTYSYVAFFPTKTKFPHHPELGSRDPFRRTVELFHNAGMRVAAYNPLNHPFMDIHAHNPEYRNWMRYDSDGKPMITRHLGWTRFYEGCLNSPLRDQIRERVREVVTNYPVDLMYFDGPYEGMDQRLHYCHCKYCKAAYRKATGKSIPLQTSSTTLEEEIEYRQWLSEDVIDGFMHEICDMVRSVRDVPTVYNDTELLGSDWRSRAYRYTDGFMFEASDTPEQKLFNMRVGQSTGKVVWTYISSHTEYNREHMKNKSVRGWYSYPVAGERLLLDGAVATAAGVGYCYWGLNRVFYVPEHVLDEPSLRSLRTLFDFAQKHEDLLRSARPAPQVGILTGTQTMGWYRGEIFVRSAYRNYYYGAYQLLKDIGYDAEPFLDYQITIERLAKYRLVYVPNAPCLSDDQCSTLANYVERGGTLVATHLTSVADEYGRARSNYGLSEVFGATLAGPEPVEIPDLYLRLLPSRKLIPQDSQVMRFKAANDATVLAETYSRGRRRTVGPAIIQRRHGKGQVIYIGSGLEAVYEETLLETLRAYFHSLLDPILSPSRTHEVEFRPGLMAQFVSSQDTLLLHLLANTGNIWKKLLVQEEFLPIKNVRARLRLPQGRTAKSVSLLWSGQSASWGVKEGWVELTVPHIQTYELVRVDLD
ncbi:MAG: beta-galactosidase trimerization domain-containing protein [Terriglobia bacterium]